MDNLSIPILFHEQEDVDREIFVVKDSFSKNSRRLNKYLIIQFIKDIKQKLFVKTKNKNDLSFNHIFIEL